MPGYDLVGVVEAVGPGVDRALLGRRVAASTKTGGWATAVLLTAADLVDGIDADDAETLIVNGLTAAAGFALIGIVHSSPATSAPDPRGRGSRPGSSWAEPPGILERTASYAFVLWQLLPGGFLRAAAPAVVPVPFTTVRKPS